MVPRLVARLALIAPFAALLFAACEHTPGDAGFPLASITITPGSQTLAISTSAQFTAVGQDANGKVMGFTPTWSVSGSGGTINSSGVYLAGTVPGTFTGTVTASGGSVSGTASVIVTAGPVATIAVTPTPDTLATGGTKQLTAVGKDAAGNVVAILPNWSVAAGGGTISSAGLFTAGMAPGTYTNTATASVGSVSGSASVTVTAAALATITVTPNSSALALGGIQTFTATGKDASGNVISPLTFTWSVVAGGGTIVSGTGVFTAGTVAGTFSNTVKATSGSVSGFATVGVNAGAAATITVTPTPDTLAIGATQQFAAVIKDAAGNILPISPNWSVAAGGGTISGTGLFTAGTVAGTYSNTATASVGSIAGSATVTVTAGALTLITVTPNPKDLAVGAKQTFTAAGKDANGNTVSVTPTWSVVAGGGTIVSDSGVFTAGSTSGVFPNTVKATSGTVSGYATVTVGSGVVATITVSPTPINMATGVSQQFTAVGRDAHGNVVPISPTWSTVGAGAINSSSGLFTAGAAGAFPDTVRATSGSISGVGVVNIVAAGALAAIIVTPNPASALEGATVQFTASGLDVGGAVVSISPAPTWSIVSSMSAAGTINSSSGLFTAGTVDGTYTNAVQATSGTISGFATVTVNATVPVVGPVLGAAATHGILAGSAVTCAGAPGTINADVSVWPGSAITGFPPCTITGVENAADPYAQTAQGDLTTAFLALAAMPCGTTITADLGGTTLAEGVYCSSTSVGVTGTVTLTGNANSVFVIRAASTLTTAGNVVMAGGALAKNVYWWVGSSATLGVGSAWQGNILALSSITLAGSVNLTGRALARNGAVSLNGTGNVITLP